MSLGVFPIDRDDNFIWEMNAPICICDEYLVKYLQIFRFGLIISEIICNLKLRFSRNSLTFIRLYKNSIVYLTICLIAHNILDRTYRQSCTRYRNEKWCRRKPSLSTLTPSLNSFTFTSAIVTRNRTNIRFHPLVCPFVYLFLLLSSFSLYSYLLYIEDRWSKDHLLRWLRSYVSLQAA